MEIPSSLDSLNNVETDNRKSINQSQQYSIQEDTPDTERRYAGAERDFLLSDIQHNPENQQRMFVIEQQQPDLYQCSSHHGDDSGSGSDSAKEEESPYSSIELPKNEAFVASGAIKEKSRIRSMPPTLCQSEEELSAPSQSVPMATIAQKGIHALSVVKEESTEVYGKYETIVPTGSGKDRPNVRSNPFEDVNIRLTTFLKGAEWPHKKPSAEMMAAAGMIFIGVCHIKDQNKTVYDMVECYKCRKRMYAFTENDDPQAERRKLYPECR